MRKIVREFLQLESASGIFLLFTTIIAMIWANSPLEHYHNLLIQSALFWINDGLMAIFFLLVGLELKSGIYSGQLSGARQVLLPGIAALGGMIVPALVNWHYPQALRGWSTPVATDIAFALGTLSLFGKRLPDSLKIFLLALAIFDDLGAILIITIFYTHGLNPQMIFQAIVLCLVLYGFNQLKVRQLTPYLLVGAWLWLCLLFSGIHPTIAGVLIAIAIPYAKGEKSPLGRLEAELHPWVAYLIMPLFALVNAGFSFQNISLSTFTDTIVLGIVLGLFIGKQVGVFGFSWLMVRLRFSSLPTGMNWSMLYGMSIICGIGFTMSLFLGTLSFQNDGLYLAKVRLGVVLGSLLSGLTGALVLALCSSQRNNRRHP
jgi:Na+:H+ antiporter, NhaA family